MKKVLFISSSGGHLSEMLQLKSMFDRYDYHIITEKDGSTLWLQDTYKSRVDYLLAVTRSHMATYIFGAPVNVIKSIYLYFKIRPQYIVTTGVHTAVPMCLIGHLFGSKVIYVDSFANIHSKSLTGKILYRYTDLFIVQWESMLELYPKAVNGGWIY